MDAFAATTASTEVPPVLGMWMKSKSAKARTNEARSVGGVLVVRSCSGGGGGGGANSGGGGGGVSGGDFVVVVRSRTMPATSRVQTDCRQRSRAARARAVGVSLPRAEAEA